MQPGDDPRPLMAELACLIYQRYYSNSAGGNMSCRVGDRLYITPRFLGSRQRWQLAANQVIVCDSAGNTLHGDAALISRESKLHFACYHQFAEVGAIIHAHPRYLGVFASAGRPLAPTSEYTEKFGHIPVVPYYPSHSQQLADAVVACLQQRQTQLAAHGAGVLLAWHGFVALGHDLAYAYDVLERLEWSAHTLLMQPLLPPGGS